jgi:cytochrome c oxidase accessory protein FixG
MRLRRGTFLLLHVVLFGAPWITVSGHPLAQLDLPGRRVFLFGSVFTPSDTIFLALLLYFLAFALFFFTAVFGRVWCGYACPQTVFLESWIRPIEIWIEGDRSQRKRRDGQSMSFDRVWRKLAKWSVFAAVAFMLAMAIMSLFAGARPLWTGEASATAYGLVAVLTAVWYADFMWFREQFCIYLCPYARFQSALTDSETLLVSYDEPRGDPRDSKRGPEGGCIDCKKCVVVCPQGIDIRDGFQLECIQCARCIDACESVMSKFEQPTLVRYSSIRRDEGLPKRRLRPRMVVYGGLMTSLVAIAVVLLVGRVPFEATVNRAPGSLYTLDADGYVRNTYLLQITNNEPGVEEALYGVRLDGLDGAQVLTPPLMLKAEETRTIPLIIRVPEDELDDRTIPFRVIITSPTAELQIPTTFKTSVDVGGLP